MHCLLKVVSKFNDMVLMHVYDWIISYFCL